MGIHSTAEKVSYEIIIDGGAPICNVVVESPRLAELDPDSPSLSEDIEELAWSINQELVRRARQEVNAIANNNPLYGWAKTLFTGHI